MSSTSGDLDVGTLFFRSEGATCNVLQKPTVNSLALTVRVLLHVNS